jgi:hypothetical protein
MRPFKTVVPVIAAWTLGLVCFAAFLTTLRDPLPPRVVTPVASSAPTHLAAEPVATEAVAKEAPVIELDPIVIVATVGRAKVASPATSNPASEAAWSCDAWRPLVQGGLAQRVRACEPIDPAGGEPQYWRP